MQFFPMTHSAAKDAAVAMNVTTPSAFRVHASRRGLMRSIGSSSTDSLSNSIVAKIT